MEMLWRRLALAVGLVCGLIGTQAPEFAQQYRQRLAGAVDELTRVVAAFDAEAQGEGLPPDAAVRRLEDNADPLARERGQDMAADKARLVHLKDALAAFNESAPVQRLFSTLETFDPTTARRAWSDYQPAIPTTVEAFTIGGAAWALGWLATHMTLWPARRRAVKRRESAALS
jgi:hypothetical protein